MISPFPVPETPKFTLSRSSRSRDPQIHPFPFQCIMISEILTQMALGKKKVSESPPAHQPFWELRDSFFSGVRSAFFTWLVPEHRKLSDKPRGQAVPEHRKFSFKPFQSPLFLTLARHTCHFISRVTPPGQAVPYAHGRVNHTLHFVDPNTGVTTNRVEAMWSRAKDKFKASRGPTNREMVADYLAEFMWSQRFRGESAFFNLWTQIARDLYPV